MNLLLGATLSALIGCSLELTSEQLQWSEFYSYTMKHNKIYEDDEERVRFQIFTENFKKIRAHNDEYLNGSFTYLVASTKFSDRSENEIRNILKGFKGSFERRGAPYVLDSTEPKDVVDWRKNEAVTSVKDQEWCGSSWAFAATGAIEGQMAIKSGELVPLSEQHLIDCTVSYGNNGCLGGVVDKAFQYVIDNNGISNSRSYPYEARNATCRYKENTAAATVKGFINIPAGDENALMSAVAKVGPVAVALHGSLWTFRHYKKGVYNDTNCKTDELDHAGLVVGYGTEDGIPYWLVKNCWGTKWGEKGYIKMLRNADNQCGIASHASYPII